MVWVILVHELVDCFEIVHNFPLFLSLDALNKPSRGIIPASFSAIGNYCLFLVGSYELLIMTVSYWLLYVWVSFTPLIIRFVVSLAFRSTAIVRPSFYNYLGDVARNA